MRPILTSNPLNPASPHNDRKANWYFAGHWIASGPTVADLAGQYPGVLSGFAAGLGWGGELTPSGSGSLVNKAMQYTASGSIKPSPAGQVFFPHATDFAVAAWGLFRPSTNQDYVALWSAAGTTIFLGVEPTGQPYFQILGSVSMSSATSVIGSGWHRHLVSVSSAAGATLYLDGMPVDRAPSLTGGGSPVDSALMGTPDNLYGWSGAAGDWNFWGRPMTDAEAMHDHLESSAGYPTALRRIGPPRGRLATPSATIPINPAAAMSHLMRRRRSM